MLYECIVYRYGSSEETPIEEISKEVIAIINVYSYLTLKLTGYL